MITKGSREREKGRIRLISKNQVAHVIQLVTAVLRDEDKAKTVHLFLGEMGGVLILFATVVLSSKTCDANGTNVCIVGCPL